MPDCRYTQEDAAAVKRLREIFESEDAKSDPAETATEMSEEKFTIPVNEFSPTK